MFALQEFSAALTERQPDWQADALCNDGEATLVELFFSEQLDDIAAAKAFCQGCAVKDQCFSGALDRREPWGVWGGELFVNGKVVAQKRKRGRPPKLRPDADEQAAQIA
jgi:WhiB family transcriptional regulator, redox-sensing transcriptional regulator